MFYVHISILPTAPSVILRGRPSEASGQELAGRVMIRLSRSLKVKRVAIVFQPTSTGRSMLWKSHDILINRLKPETKELFSANGSEPGYAVWDETSVDGPHEFPFSFAVPGYLHESARTQYGNIDYELKVIVQSSGFGINNWTQTLPMPVYRLPKEGSSWEFARADSFRMNADWLDAVQLEVLSSSVSVVPDSKMQVRAVIRPLQKEQMLVDVGLRLYEKIKIKSALNRYGDPFETQKLICQSHERTEDPEGDLSVMPLRQESCFDLTLSIPKPFDDIQYDAETCDISIKHELVFTATVLDKNEEPHYLRISSPVAIVLQNTLGPLTLELPDYRNSSMDRLLLSNIDDKSESPPSYSPCILPQYNLSSPNELYTLAL